MPRWSLPTRAASRKKQQFLGFPASPSDENTERPVTVEYGTNTIAGTKTDAIKDAIRRQLGGNRDNGVPKNWDGRAGERIIDILVRTHREKTSFRSVFIPHTEPLEARYARP